MTELDLIDHVAILLSYLLVIMALAISASSTLKQMVRLYQAQAWVLTAVVLLTSLAGDRVQLAVALLALLPAALAVAVPPLLGRASLTRLGSSRRPARGWPGLRGGLAGLRRGLREPVVGADLIWLQHGRSRLRGGLSASIDMLLIAMAVLVAYRLALDAEGQAAGSAEAINAVPNLAVAIALVLQGLFTMGNKQDIIAQVIGLLVIEHGLFVAAVRVAPSALAFLLVLSLFLYVLVTLTILLWILPELHHASDSIEVDDHRQLKG